MKLISLKINNFRVIKAAKIDFPDKVIGIIGPNGAGKSSIIEAISYALYGNQSARSGKDEIKGIYAKPAEDCRVELEFLINEGKYKVIRKLVGKSERAEVELYFNDAPESVGVNETKNYVGELLGLDWRGFLSSFLARQSELNALSDLSPAKRRDHIAGMLGIQKLDKAIENAKKDGRFYRDRATSLEQLLSEKDTISNRIAELEKELAELTPRLTSVEADYNSARTNFKEQAEKYEQIQAERDKYQKLAGLFEAEEQSLSSINERIEKLETEKETLIKLHDKANVYKIEIEQLPLISNKLDYIKEQQHKAEEKTRLNFERNKFFKESKIYITKSKSLKAELNDNKEKLDKIPLLLDQDIVDIKQQREVLRENYSQTKAQFQTDQNEINRISKQLESVSELGPESVCDRCLRPMGNDFESITSHLKKELTQYENSSNKTNTLLIEIEAKGKALSEALAKLEENITIRDDLKAKFKNIQKEIDLNNEYHKNLAQKYKEMGELISGIKTEYFEPAEIEKIKAEHARLLETKSEYDRITGRIKRYDDVVLELDTLAKQKKVSADKVQNLKEAIKALEYSETKFEQLKLKFIKTQTEFEAKKESYLSLSKNAELLKQELKLKIEQQETFNKTAKELEQSRDDHYHVEKLGNLFSDYRKDLIASIRPTLADMSSKLLSDMTNGMYSLVELDEKYNLRVNDSGQYYGVDRFSGGEKDLANLCLRLAISQALTDSAGLESSFVILDEVFGSQDNERKELILSALANLKVRFPQIILISHIEDVKNGVEELIEVRPTGYGWSEVFVNEQVV